MEQHGDRQGLFPMRARRQASLFVAALALLMACWAGEAKAQYGSVGTAAGYLPIGTTTIPASMLGVYGGVTIGSSYISTTAPTNGAIIQGNVGMATTSPSMPTGYSGSAAGSLIDINNGLGSGVFVSAGNSGGQTARFGFVKNYDHSLQYEWQYQPAWSNRLTLWSAGAGGTVIDVSNTGNIGFGTTGEVNKLDVNGGVAIGSYAGVNTAPSNGLIVSGNVGIGTTSPVARLNVEGVAAALHTFPLLVRLGLIRPCGLAILQMHMVY